MTSPEDDRLRQLQRLTDAINARLDAQAATDDPEVRAQLMAEVIALADSEVADSAPRQHARLMAASDALDPDLDETAVRNRGLARANAELAGAEGELLALRDALRAKLRDQEGS